MNSGPSSVSVETSSMPSAELRTLSDVASALADGSTIKSAIQEAEDVMGLKTSAKTKQNYASGARQVVKFLLQA